MNPFDIITGNARKIVLGGSKSLTANSTPIFSAGALDPKPTYKPQTFAETPLGIAANTVIGIPKATWDVSKGIADFLTNLPGQTARFVGETGGDIYNAAVPESQRKFEVPASSNIFSVLPGFGTEPIKTKAAQIASGEQKLQEFGFGKASLPIAFGGIVGLTALDWTGFGGGKTVLKGVAGEIPEQFLKFVAKTSDEKILRNTFLQIGVKDPVLVERLASELSSVTKPKQVETVFKDLVTNYKPQKAIGAPKIFSDLHPEDQAYLSNLTDKFTPGKNKAPITEKEWQVAEKIWTDTGATIPKTRTEFIDNIRTAEQSAFDKPIEIGLQTTPTPRTVQTQPLLERGTVSLPNSTTEKPQGIIASISQLLKDMKNVPNAEGGFAKVPFSSAEYDPGYFKGRSKKLSPELEQKLLEVELRKDAIANNPLNNLTKYVATRGDNAGKLPEVLGGNSTKGFKKSGDSIVTEATGLNMDSETARAKMETFIEQKKAVKELEQQVKSEVAAYKPPVKLSSEGIPLAPTKRQREIMKSSQGTQTTTGLKPQLVSPSKKVPTYSGTTGEIRSLEEVVNQSLGDSNIPQDIKRNVSLTKIIEKSPTPVKVKVNVLDYLKTPENVLKKIGLSNEMDAIRRSYDNYVSELPIQLNKVTEWAKSLPKESSRKIFRYLDGEAIDLSPDELRVAKEIQIYLKNWADRLQLPEDKRIADYITHIFDDQLIKKEFDEDLAKIISDKIPGSVYNPFLQSRLGAKGYKQDVWAALDAYIKRATRKINLDPALAKLESAASGLEESQWNYVKRLADRINMRPTEIDNLVDNAIKSIVGYRLGQRPVASLTKGVRRWTYRGMLGLNVGSALRNLSQGINTYAKLGEKYTAIGYAKLFSKANRAELEASGVLSHSFVQDRQIAGIKKVMEKFDKGLFYMFEQAEKINRGAAYFGAKSKALAAGKTEEEAIQFAKKIVRETQFQFGSIDTPVGMSSDIVKTLTQFQTFTTKQIEFLAKMAKNKEYAGLIRYVIAGLAFVYTVGQAFGMKPQDLAPIYRIGIPPSLKFPWEVFSASVGMTGDYGEERSAGQKLEDIVSTLPGYIPAGIQAKKTIQGIQAIQQGGSYDAAGRLQFVQGQSKAQQLQAILFGKYASQQAKDYFNRGEISKEEKAKVQPVFDEVQKMAQSGDEQGALDLYNQLSDSDKETYRKIQTAEKAKKTQEGKKQVLPTFNKVQELAKTDEQGALALYNSLSDEQKKYYKLVKDDMKRAKEAESGDKPKFNPDETTSDQSVISTVWAYAKAIGVDPATAFDRIFTGQKIRYVSNGTVVVERLPLSASQAEKKAQGGTGSDVKLDHTVPLQLGGSNEKSNLKLVPTTIWESYTPVENFLGTNLRAGKLSKKEVQSLISDFKAGKITALDVYNSVE
jgi:hypothetical protein